jgi:hypothetical protein
VCREREREREREGVWDQGGRERPTKSVETVWFSLVSGGGQCSRRKKEKRVFDEGIGKVAMRK